MLSYCKYTSASCTVQVGAVDDCGVPVGSERSTGTRYSPAPLKHF